MKAAFFELIFLLAAVGFILTLQGLSSVKTAQRGNVWGMGAMALSVLATLAYLPLSFYPSVLAVMGLGSFVGGVIALKTPMMALPQLMAAFHSLVGLAAVCVARAAFIAPEVFGLPLDHLGVSHALEMALGATIGALTFTGSLMAFLKLQGSQLLRLLNPLRARGALWRNMCAALWLGSFLLFLLHPHAMILSVMISLGFALGVFLVLPIGGADMPVVVSMLNSYSGWAASGIGFTLDNPLLIIVGALVGSSGAILSYMMCEGMNRPFWQVIFGHTSSVSTAGSGEETGAKSFKQGSADDAAFLLQNARKVIVVPGYGMAVAQAQHALKEMVDVLRKEGVNVQFAIHPVAGRMPGHMNVLLAEAQVPYEDVRELEEINGDFAATDVAIVIGANDITNPSAKTDKTSPLYGMPMLDVERAQTVLFVKRSMGAGYAGIDNPLFYEDKTFMLLGDAKQVCENVTKSLRTL